jgi:hypothetical protein
MLHLILGGAVAPDFRWRSAGAPRFWRDGVERFTAAMTGLFSEPALQFAEKLTFRIRAPL